MKLTMLLLKVVLPMQYSNKKINFRTIKLILDLENSYRKLITDVFNSPQSKGLKRYKKSPASLWNSTTVLIHDMHTSTLNSCQMSFYYKQRHRLKRKILLEFWKGILPNSTLLIFPVSLSLAMDSYEIIHNIL